MKLVYYSRFGNVEKFVKKLNHPIIKIDNLPQPINDGYILITPTYREPRGSYIPLIINDFLRYEKNWFYLRGVIASGDINFTSTFCKTGFVLSSKYKVPLYHFFEGSGTDKDVLKVKDILTQ